MVKNLVEKQDMLVEKESDKEPKIYVPVMPMKYLQDTLKKDMFDTFDKIRLYANYKEQAVSTINLVHKYYDTLMAYLQVYYSAYNYVSNSKYSKEFGKVNGDAPLEFQKWVLWKTDAYEYCQRFTDAVEAPKDNNGDSLSLSSVVLAYGDFGVHYSVEPQEVSFAYNTNYVIKVLRKEDVGNMDTEISISRSSHDLRLLTNDIIVFVNDCCKVINDA